MGWENGFVAALLRGGTGAWRSKSRASGPGRFRQKADVQHPQAGPRSFPAVAVQKRPLLYGGCNSPFEAHIYVR